MTQLDDDIMEVYFDANRAHFISELNKSRGDAVAPKNQSVEVQKLKEEIEQQNVTIDEQNNEITRLRNEVIRNSKLLKEKKDLEEENARLREEIGELKDLNRPFDFKVPEIVSTRMSRREIENLELENAEFEKFYQGLKRVEETAIMVEEKLKTLDRLIEDRDAQMGAILRNGAEGPEENAAFKFDGSKIDYSVVAQPIVNEQHQRLHECNSYINDLCKQRAKRENQPYYEQQKEEMRKIARNERNMAE